MAKYKAYIDAIAANIKKHPNTKVALVIGKPCRHMLPFQS